MDRVDVASLVTFGRGGHMVYWVPKWDEHGRVSSSSTTSGYDSPELFVREVRGGKYERAYWPEPSVPVVDLRELARTKPGEVVGLPLVEPGSWLPDPFERVADHARLMLPGLSGGFETLVRAGIRGWKGLDRVPKQEYLAQCRQIGARIGEFDGYSILWDGGEVTA